MCVCWWSDQKRPQEKIRFEERLERSKRADHGILQKKKGIPAKQKQKSLQIPQGRKGTIGRAMWPGRALRIASEYWGKRGGRGAVT